MPVHAPECPALGGGRAQAALLASRGAGAGVALDHQPLDRPVDAAVQPVIRVIPRDPVGSRVDAHGARQIIATLWAATDDGQLDIPHTVPPIFLGSLDECQEPYP